MAQYVNMTVEDTDDELVIRIKKNGQTRPSSSGKTMIIATIGKPKVVTVGEDGQDIYLGVNCYKYPPR